LVLALGLVILLIMKARDPGNFAWIDKLGDQPATPADDRPVDTRSEPAERPNEPAGTFVSPAAPAREEDAEGRLLEVKPEDLAVVEDDTHFRAAETKAWFHLFAVLKDTSPAKLRQASLGRVTFMQLFQQPKEYRGRVVSIQGTVRRAHWVKAPANAARIEGYYQLWVQPSDHPDDPMVLYALELPKRFPTGMDVAADVRVTGFFFKCWAYQAQDTLRTAPVLLSRSVDWTPATPAVPRGDRQMPSPWLVVGLAAAIAAFVVGFLYLRSRPSRRPRVEVQDRIV
jgi:hypothetical protein